MEELTGIPWTKQRQSRFYIIASITEAEYRRMLSSQKDYGLRQTQESEIEIRSKSVKENSFNVFFISELQRSEDDAERLP